MALGEVELALGSSEAAATACYKASGIEVGVRLKDHSTLTFLSAEMSCFAAVAYCWQALVESL